MLNREQKEILVGDLREKIDKARAVFLTNLIGVPSNRANEVRKAVRDAKGTVIITRNTLFERAGKGTAAEEILTGLKGTNALAIAFEDAPGVAKALYEAGKEDESITLEHGLLGGKLLEKSELLHLAKLPSRGVMLGTFLATLQAPVGSFVRVLDAIREQKAQGEDGGQESNEQANEEQSQETNKDEQGEQGE